LAALEKKSLLHHYVQQNHDGLPQKAGFPQEKMNEIHGAWFDPSNTVVKFSGSLRDDLFESMLEMEKKIDLCLCLGTSLSGMNADRVAETPAKKLSKKQKGRGTVIVNLQQTRLDEICSIRIWAKLDDVFKLLNTELRLGVPDVPILPKMIEGSVFWLPFDENGHYDAKSRVKMDFSEGAKIKVCQKGSTYGKTGTITGVDYNGNWKISLKGHRYAVRLGRWWIESAQRGAIKQFPIINVDPVVKSAEEVDAEAKEAKEEGGEKEEVPKPSEKEEASEPKSEEEPGDKGKKEKKKKKKPKKVD